ncbi:hypothetical protein [Chroogloeocystis siderophila]
MRRRKCLTLKLIARSAAFKAADGYTRHATKLFCDHLSGLWRFALDSSTLHA